ncbi:MAG: T9SS type A sorting domain-containing protein [Bacteroidetes bacterium]|nr:T9SS type A sorting domain-containing protein [Bacteroidota bacterium]
MVQYRSYYDFNVCYDMNHDSPDTRYFVDRVTEFWIQQFHFDGYRFDLAKGFTQTYSLGNVSLWGHYDSSRVYNIERMANHIWSIDTNAYVILEMFADNSEEQHYSNDGMMLWGNVNYNYYMATMGNVSASNFSSVNYKAHGWSKPHLIGYMESHDEERVMYKNLTSGYSSGTYNVKDTATALRRMEMAGAFFYTVPGPKMAWMGGELGYDISINNPCRTCSHPFKWNYYSRPNSLRLYKVWSAIINLRNDYPAFRTTNFNMQTSQAGKSIHLNNSAMNVTIVGNFDVNAISFNPVFQNTGWWYDYLTGDSIEVLNTTSPLALEPGEYHIYTTVKLSTPNLSIGIAETEAEDNFAYAFPNPANSFTSFGMYLSKSSNVRIEIYRINGQKIDEIDAGRLSPGEHMIDWSFADKELASGLYICRISAGNQTQHIKIVID